MKMDSVRLSKNWVINKKHRSSERCFLIATQVYKPGSVLTAIYLVPQLLTGSSRLLETVGQTLCFSTALLRDRVYIVKPMLPWAGWALTPPFHPYSSIHAYKHLLSRKRKSAYCMRNLLSPSNPHTLGFDGVPFYG